MLLFPGEFFSLLDYVQKLGRVFTREVGWSSPLSLTLSWSSDQGKVSCWVRCVVSQEVGIVAKKGVRIVGL